jgi:hypothetical protein
VAFGDEHDKALSVERRRAQEALDALSKLSEKVET